jgi:hypothetical protein
MNRIQLPQNLRNFSKDFLLFISNKFDIYRPIVPIIEKGLAKTPNPKIIDLTSGTGRGWLSLRKHLIKKYPNLRVTLTDFCPNLDALGNVAARGGETFEFMPTSVDARFVSSSMKGMRTQFLSLHHFCPEDATLILQSAVEAQTPIAIFELQERTWKNILTMIFSPINVLFSTPFIKPFKISRLIFTYLIPIVPFIVLWDGVASCLRTYSESEMQQLVEATPQYEAFEWEIGRIHHKGMPILYLLGCPK